MITPPDRITYISARTTTIRHAMAPNATHTTVATKQNWIATKSEVMPDGAAVRIASAYWIPNSITPDGLSADVTGMPAIALDVSWLSVSADSKRITEEK